MFVFPTTENEIELHLLLKEMERRFEVLYAQGGDYEIKYKIIYYKAIRKQIDLLKQQYMNVLNGKATEEMGIKLLEDFINTSVI